MKRNGKLKKILISVVAVVLVVAIGGGVWFFFSRKNAAPVNVYQFMYIGMTEYWGDSKESYGPVSTDRMQTIYLSSTQNVTEIFVQPGDTVKKGDLLLTFDTTLSDLSLERKRLDVEKLKLQLEDAKARLREINAMTPMVIPTPDPDPNPGEENLGVPLTQSYRILSQDASDGSTPETAMVCWLNSGTQIDDALFEALRAEAEALAAKNQAQAPAPEESTAAQADNPTDPSQVPTEPTASPTEPSTEPTEPSTQPTEPAAEPTEPEAPEVNSFYVVFKVTSGDLSLAQNTTWQGIYVNRNPATDRFTFQFFDASGVEDPALVDASDSGSEDPGFDFGSGYTASQIAQMRSEQEKTIKELEFNIKMTEADYKIMQAEVSDGNVYAEIDGTVVSLLSEEEAKTTMQPFLKLSGGGGFYITGSISELDKDTLEIGQEVTINDWRSGMMYSGTVQSIGDYPTDQDGYSGMGNPNVSYYPFTVFVDGDADLTEGYYVSVQYSAGASTENGIYLENPFIRTENGKSYVYVQGEDGLLVKRYVTTGKALWGSYTEILSGLSETDLIAFPYGKNVTEGAKTVEGELSDLYNY